MIAVTLDMAVVRKKDVPSLWVLNSIITSIASLASGLPFTTNSYGSSGAWCWILATGISNRGQLDAGGCIELDESFPVR